MGDWNELWKCVKLVGCVLHVITVGDRNVRLGMEIGHVAGV